MKKVLIIGPFPEPTTGVSLANEVLKKGLQKETIFGVDFINTSLDKFDEGLGKFSFGKIWFYLKLNFFAYKLFRTEVVYITPGQTFFGILKYTLFILLGALLKRELIIHVHGNHLGKEFRESKGFKKGLLKLVLCRFDKGIVLSKSLINNCSDYIKDDNIFIVKNFVEDYLFISEAELENKFNNPIPRVVYLSNLMLEKGIYDFLGALRILEEKGIKYEARIAGNIDEELKSEILDIIGDLKYTTYLGVVKGPEKRNLLSWSTIFILPTYYKMEGQPISIIEAMAMGNVVITTKHSGIPDIFEDNQNGLFVEKQDSNSIVNAILSLSPENVEKVTKFNSEYASQDFRVSRYIDDITNVMCSQIDE